MRLKSFSWTFLLVVLASLPIGAANAGPFMVFNVNNGRILEQDSAFARWYPASLTKLMTAYVTFRALQSGEVTLASPVRMTRNASRQPPSKIGLRPGTVLTLDNALKLMLVKSANDMAMAVGENVGGSEEAFVERMNKEAVRLGMTGTHYANPNGLFNPQNYTTARDLAVLVTAIRRDFPQYQGYFTIEGIQLGKRVLHNYDLLIGRFDGADGMKTGFICASGYNFIGTATRNGRTLAAIVLGATSVMSRTERVAELLHQGFSLPDSGPTLAELQPYGPGQGDATDMHDQVCTRQAAARDPIRRDRDGEVIFPEPYIHDMDRPPNLVMVQMGGATGPGGLPPAPHYADVPIPTPRPDFDPLPLPATNPAPHPTARAQVSAGD